MVFGQVTGNNPYNRGETTVSRPSSSEVCFEFTAKRKLTLHMMIKRTRYNLTQSYDFDISYNGFVGEESYKSCIDKDVAKELEQGECKTNFETESTLLLSYGQLPTIIPFGGYYWKKDLLPANSRQWAQNPFTGLWGFQDISTDVVFKWTPGPIIDLGSTVTEKKISFFFEVVCKNNECWPCKPKDRSPSDAPPVFGETTVVVKPCNLGANYSDFSGEMNFSLTSSQAESIPHFHYKKSYIDSRDGGNGPVTPTHTGWHGRIFSGDIRTEIDIAIGALGMNAQGPVEFCADIPGFPAAMRDMGDAWWESEGPDAPGGGFGEGT